MQKTIVFCRCLNASLTVMVLSGCRFSRESSMALCNIGQSCLCPGSLFLVFGLRELAAYAPHEHVV